MLFGELVLSVFDSKKSGGQNSTSHDRFLLNSANSFSFYYDIFFLSFSLSFHFFISLLCFLFYFSVINFEEFLLSLWAVLTMTELNMARFIYQLFDIEKNDDLTVLEITELISILCDRNDESLCSLNLAFENMKLTCSNIVTNDQFFCIIKEIPTLLLPIKDVIDKLRIWTLNVDKWNDISVKRSLNYGDQLAVDINKSLRSKPICLQKQDFRFVFLLLLTHLTVILFY